MTWKRFLAGALLLVVLSAYLATVGVRAAALARDLAQPGLSAVKSSDVAGLFVPSVKHMGRRSGEGFEGLLFLVLYAVAIAETLLSAGAAYVVPFLGRRARALGLGAAVAAFALPLLLALAWLLSRTGPSRPRAVQETLFVLVGLAVLGCIGFWSAALVTCLVNRVEPWSRPRAGEPAPAAARANGVSYAVVLAAPPLAAAAALYFGLVWDPQRELCQRALLGDAPKVKALLASGASPDRRDRGGRTPLAAAAASGSAQTVALLLEAGADVNRTDGEDATPLHAAARSQRSDVVKLLIAHGAKLDVVDGQGGTPLAAGSHDAATVQALLDAGASPEFHGPGGPTPLMAASRENNTEGVKLLIARGAKVNGREPRGATALICALDARALAAARLLLERGADQGPPAKTPDGASNESAMPHAVGGGPDAVLLLLDFGADPDQWAYGRPLLHHAAQFGWLAVAKRLAEAKVEVNRAVPGQGTALDLAARYKQQEVLDYLLSVGAKGERELAAVAESSK